jgi:Ca-activated chloride channel family protein
MRFSHSFAIAGAIACSVFGCKDSTPATVVSEGDTFAEMRTIKGEATIAAPGEEKRAPYPRERIQDGEDVTLAAGALAWIRRDAGAVWLVEGPAKLTWHSASVKLESGRAFVDAEDGAPVVIDSPRGAIELSDARASVELGADGTETVYVLRGAARAKDAARATAGEALTLASDGKIERVPAVAWDDWTGGLATADPAAEPAPFGLGTVGARPPGDKGKPRFSLVVERLDVRVTIDHDFAITEVDQTFVNPSSNTVEGLFSFRTPPGAVLHKFGVDRDGELVWGKVKESAAAQKQYESNVYEGSTEDPALLAWVAPGVYNARLYPINAGAKRRVVTRYAEWLSRQGPKADRRLYVYPMAAEGAKGSLPRIEELRVTLDLSKAGASRVRTGMGGKQNGTDVVINAFDFVPRADLAVELFDGGQSDPVAYRAPHGLTAADVPMNSSADYAAKVSSEEPDYLLVPLRSTVSTETKGMDLAIVVDTSAATESGALSIARSLTSALLAHLGPDDRAALWAGDATLRPVFDGSGDLVTLDPVKRRAWLAGLAAVERGGATDIGALLSQAASKLDPKRRGAILYIGDGLPSVGEISPKALHERLARLPEGTRVLAAAVGARANVALLDSITRGAPVEPVGDAYGAARAALRLLEAAQKPAWIGATVDLGPGVDRVLPRALPPVGADESVLVVGRVSGKEPTQVNLTGGGTTVTKVLHVIPLADSGDLRRRWGQGRMEELLGEGAGRASLVDVARRYSLVSPYTSLYVPTAREAAQEKNNGAQDEDTIAQERSDAIDRRRRWRPWSRSWNRDEAAAVASVADNKEGGTGTRAKGEEGSMGNPSTRNTNMRYGVRGPSAADVPADMTTTPQRSREQAVKEAQEFGMIGLLPSGGNAAPWGTAAASAAAAPPAQMAQPPPADQERKMAPAARAKAASDPNAPAAPWGLDEDGNGAAMSGLASVAGGSGGGGRGEGIGTGTGQGFGNGHGRLGGAHATRAPSLRQGATTVNGRLPPEVIQRIVRQNFGRFRLCYENGLRTNPSLQGRITVKFTIDRSGSVSIAQDGGSDLPDQNVVACTVRGFGNLSFPQPEGGIVVVQYPIIFSPGDDNSPPTPAPMSPPVQQAVAAIVLAPTGPIAIIGHAPRPCGPAAELSLSDRRVLWSERLQSQSTAAGAINVYRGALDACEAPTWRERTTLLLLMVESLRSVTERVALWKSLIATPAADVIYRAIVVRVQTVAELHELHQALGLAQVDPDLLANMLKGAKTPQDKLSVLRAASQKWPDDLELGLRVLDAYEDAADDGGGRAWARRLRRRADATAHVWTSVGEYYLRVAAHQTGAAAEHDATEGRRTFGELVEFAPDDPGARRRLGDLLRAHGWYDEAFRQYLTLQQLTPDDPSVPLLLASAAQGMGRVEEAVGWAEKAAAAGSPDGKSTLSRSARATASAFLAWAREDAIKQGKNDDAEKLTARAKRLAAAGATTQNAQAGGVRIIVTWSHPELHPSLWTTTLGAPMPAPDNFPVFGVAETRSAGAGPTKIELRLDPDDAARAARLGLTATVTAITAEGSANEKTAKLAVGFGTLAAPADRVIVTFDNGALKTEAP